ncbi:MAG: deoxyribose-phosphate aldolase [Waddliaceae bacterium]|jgi:deoxyribose-phosphate aldolase|nr:deoxyribose-phosphate aldolase [Waddliaceae bacterium]MBT4444546.1 deoxyribose-phosphate aldolase [Waddliaceae bacterium]
MKENIANFIDHTLLKPDAILSDIKKLCSEAREYHFYSVCVNPCWVSVAKDLLKDSDVKVGAAVGFPLGASTSAVKAFEARDAIGNGAEEIDMVMNIGAALERRWDYVEDDIKGVVSAADGRCVKVIIETCLLSEEQIIAACHAAEGAGARFVKTSTGFNGGGATVEAVKVMHGAVSDDIGVKASGGIKDEKTALAMVEAGATRLGTSSGIAIIQ